MVPPVWTLLLLVGAAHLRREKPPDKKLVVRSSRDNYVLTQCDFEDDAKPLCDWSQVSADDGDWVRASGPSPTGTTGPPGGYPNGEGSYLHMESNNFHRGGVARLLSPNLWEQGPLCVNFAYHMFGLSWGSQLRLLLLSGEEGRRPHVLWKHGNTQRPSWMPTTVTVPVGFTLPTRLMFEGTRGSTAYLDIALDALSIRRGSCNRVASSSEVHADWLSELGAEGVLGGHYMLLDPKNARPGQKAVLLSPVSPSSGCLSFSFHYVLRGQSPGAALHVYASVLGSIRKHTLFSGQPGPNWQAVSVNYTAVGRIQFTVVGVFGKTPEPAVAVDATSIAPCGEGFPRCDFEDSAHPFCDWVQTSGDGGHWALGHKNGPVHSMGPVRGFPSAGGHYIYLEADKFSQAGQSARLVSRTFCAPGDICVEFAYHMYGLGEGTMLELLLGSPAGSPPIPLWKRVGSQRPYWQNTSVTIPSGHQQPMQLTFKAIWGSNMAFVVAMGFILINPGTCPATIPTEKLTALRPPHPSPTATGLAALVMSPHAPSAPMTSVILDTTTTPRPNTERCPPNAHYESCACPASCKSPRPSCGPLCRGDCVCNLGFLFSDNHCIQASSCNCFYNNNYYEPGAEWFSPNCTERCRCWPGSRVECQISQCGTHTVCQLKNGQYGCHPYAGTATCLVYGDPHYVTFDGRHFGFMGKCSYILAQPCGNSTDPFFRVTAKNEEQGQEGVSCLSKVYVTLPETTVTLLKGRRTLVEGQRVTLPAIPSKGVFLGASGRFVELQTEFGLRVRWDGDQQLYVTVSRCQKHQVVNPPSCDSSLQSSMSGPGFCGRLVDTHGPFETCLLHVKATSFFDSCMLDMCRFQGLQHLLCTHMSTMTTTCQHAGHAVKPWREPQFCPMACPPNSKYSLCAKPCPDTCHSGFTGMFCSDRCMEACECNPGFVLSGLECVPRSQCGCLHPAGSYFKVGERWYKLGCKELCVCESNNRIRCQPWRCRAQEFCGLQDGIYGCHAQGAATCTASGDPHYLTFDGALHHFMGTCTYVLTRPCWSRSQDSYFVVSATNENRGGNLEVSYIKAVHVTVFDLSISLLRGCKVMLNGHRVALPVWPAQGRVTIRLSSNFVLLYTNFGLQVRYDGSHLVEVTVPSSYGGQLCGLCGNYNNNSLDDNQRPDRKPAGDSVQLGAAWKLPESSEPGCFLVGGKPSSCQENSMADAWNKNCAILINPQGPFSQCHQVVPPQSSFASCMHDQCRTKGDTTALCRSLQAYASLCARAGQAPAWRNRTFCPMRCPPGSSYSPCGSPCPATCSSINDPRDCPKALPCAESCECQKGYILSGTSCVPLGQCGCTDPAGSYHPVGERWYTEDTCTRLCMCSIHNNITCFQSTCKPNQMCWTLDGLLRCRVSGMGVCQLPGESHYVSFDGSNHSIPDACPHVLVKVCHPAMALPFFKISAKHEKEEGGTEAFRLHEVYIDIYDAQVTLQKGHRVLINSKKVTLPAISQIPGVSVKSSSIYTIVNIKIGVQVKFDGNRLLEIELPTTYYGKVCGVCGNFNDEEEDELMMPSDELAHSDSEFVNSWKDKDIDPSCQSLPVDEQQIPAEQQENPSGNCRAADLRRAREKCEAALRAPVWAQCASRIDLMPFLVGCTNTLCEFGGLHQALCQALQDFGATCQSQGLKPPLWRNSSFCPLECPAYSSYTNCLPSCSPSCWDLDGRCEGAKVPSACAEGCICQPGYVLSEDKCVPRSQCGCKDAHGGSIPLGKSWVSRGCTEKCVCTGGAIQCGDFRCPSGSHCQLSSDNSKSNCVSDKSEQCSVYGDPHYLTFDGFSYRFQGRMTYVLIKTVDVLPEGVEPLLVEGRNKMDPPRSSTFLQEVITTVYGYKVQLQAGLELVVNNQKMAVPYRPNEHLRVTLRGQRLYLVTNFELVVSFGGRKNAVISLPSMYEGLVRGLCGNYDKNRKNDVMLPSGALTQNLNTFGNSWEVKTEDVLLRFPRAIPVEERRGVELSFHVSECSPEQLASNSIQACRVLADPQGPFAACHQTVAAEPFQEHCVLDLCSTQDPREQEELRCQVLSGHGVSSRYHVSELYDTLPSVLCQPGGPRGLRRPLRGRLCQHPRLCLQRHPEPPLADCGCTSNGIYYQLGSSFVTEDCSQRCTCASSRILLCEPFSCREGEVCTLGNHTRGCFPESPCLRNPCQNDGQCQEQGATFTCECEVGYGGDLCTEPRDMPAPRKPASNPVAVLLGLLVPVVVVVLAVTRECIYRMRRKREKMQGQEGDRLARLVDTDIVLDCAG
ncbi:PREDICTED: LOW QUALITY PROTEIN: zonadhesin [Colobus angolensis palliatus]|uniref:LOW QUALITY PROTEIN: zonadhesin n=1 Tax=Colobus angolensis palliatus TaxID=336983 RepID=UPI0005F46425|nr:PREDICTED: LOW QUALITY PROTEIN: zonadhesin [Colobus angolensis palliatus]